MPIVTFPKTGRSWQHVLPTALAAVEAIMDAYAGGSKRCKFLMMICGVLFFIVALHKIPGTAGCPIIQDSCRDKCECCQTCHNTDKEDALFCYYKGTPGYPDQCADGDKNIYCRCVGSKCSDNTLSAQGCPCNMACNVAPTGGRLLLGDIEL